MNPDPFDAPTSQNDADANPAPDRTPDRPEPAMVTRRTSKPSVLRNTVEWVVVIVGAVLIALLIRNFVVQSYQIPSGSMMETLQEGRLLRPHKTL